MSYQKIITNTSSQWIGKIGTILIGFLVVKIVSSFGSDFYGKYVTVYEFLAFFGIMADAGLFAIAVKEISPLGKKDPQASHILGNILSMRLLLIFAMTLLAGIVAQYVNNYDPWIKTGIWIAGLSMALTVISGTLSSILQARMKIQYFALSLFIGKVLLAIFIFFIFLNQDFWSSPQEMFFSFLWAGVLSNAFFTILVYYFARKETPIRLYADLEYWKKTFTYSLPYGIALVLQTLYLRIDLILISILLGTSSVGIYGISARVLESFLILGVFFGQAVLPKISTEKNDSPAMQKTLIWGMEKLLIVSLPIIWGGMFFAQEIVLILSHQDYLSSPLSIGSEKILLLLLPTIFFAFFNQLFSFTLLTQKKQIYLLITNALVFGVNVLLNLIFLPQYGIIAAAVSTIFCEILVFGFLLYPIIKKYKIAFRISNLIIILGLNALLFLAVSQTSLQKSFLLAVIFSGLMYSLSLWFFRKRFMKI